MNVIARLALSLLKVKSHTMPRTIETSSKHAIRLSKHDVLRQADSSAIVKRI